MCSSDLLRGEVASYFQKLKDKNVEDAAIAQPHHATTANLMALIVGFIPFALGWLGHQIPRWYAQKVRNERVKYLEFRGPVMAAVGFGATIVQYLLLIFIAVIINKLAFWGFVFSLPIMGYFAIFYYDLWQKYTACNRLKSLNTEGVAFLQNDRNAILKMVKESHKIKS